VVTEVAGVRALQPLLPVKGAPASRLALQSSVLAGLSLRNDAGDSLEEQAGDLGVACSGICQHLPGPELESHLNQSPHPLPLLTMVGQRVAVGFGGCRKVGIRFLPHQVIQLGHEVAVVVDVPFHCLICPVPAVQLREGALEPVKLLLSTPGGSQVRRWVAGEEAALACSQQIFDFGEIVVDRQSLDTGPPGDLRNGGPGRSDLLVERLGGGDDAVPCLLLPQCPRLELILSAMT
jgi:hypothetical protein